MNLMVRCYLYGRNPKREVVKLARWLPHREYIPGAPIRVPLAEARARHPGLAFEWASAAVDSPSPRGVGQDAAQLSPVWTLARGQLPGLTGDLVLYCGPLLEWVEVYS